MAIKDLLSLIDAEIARLREARSLLASSTPSSPITKARPGRPRLIVDTPSTAKKSKKRNLSPEGRAKIAAAVKRRWAKQKALAK